MVAAPPAPPPVAPGPRGTTARDGAQTRAAVARLSHGGTVTERMDGPDTRGTMRRHLVVEFRDARLPAFRLDRHERAVVLSERDGAATWTLGWFGGLTDALAMLRREVLARAMEAAGSPEPHRAAPA